MVKKEPTNKTITKEKEVKKPVPQRKKIDIFSIQPHVISRDMGGKSYCFYGTVKSGKTTVACKFPRPLLMGFEKGYNLISGVLPQPIMTWEDAIVVREQLKSDAKNVESGVKPNTHYKTVIMDTGNIAYSMIEDYICKREGVPRDRLDLTENKTGYNMCKKEYSTFLNDLMKCGYTVIIIFHAETVEKKVNNVKTEVTQPETNKRALSVVKGLVDTIGYVTNDSRYIAEFDNCQSVIIQRACEDSVIAGSRNPYAAEMLPFTYEALEEDMRQSIDRLEAEGAMVTNKPIESFKDQTEIMSYEDLMDGIEYYAGVFEDTDRVDIYCSIVEKYLGKGRKVSVATEDQASILQLIYDDLTIEYENLAINGALEEEYENVAGTEKK